VCLVISVGIPMAIKLVRTTSHQEQMKSIKKLNTIHIDAIQLQTMST